LVEGKTSTSPKIQSKEWTLFPYKPYNEQLKFMKDIRNVVGNGGILVAEACNGFGKTVCALSSILPLDRFIVYVTRTHEQVRQILLEIENINRSSTKQYTAVNLASRQHLCLNEKCKKLSTREGTEACRLLKRKGQCIYKTEKISYNTLASVLSIEKLKSIGLKKRVCPYFYARKMAENYNIIVAPYQYIFNEHIKNRVKLTLKHRILVFDEAHNADQIGQEVLSNVLSEKTLDNARRELEDLGKSSEFINNLINYLDQKVSDVAKSETAESLYNELKQVLSINNLSLVASNYSDCIEDIRNNKIERGDYPVSFLNGVLTFLKQVDSSLKECYVAIYRKSFYNYNVIEYRCLDPSLAIEPVVNESHGSLIMSGTLSPIALFSEILGLKKSEKRSYSAIANPKNIRTTIDVSVTTRFKERSRKMNVIYGQRLHKLLYEIPNGVLVFFPQRKFMLDNLNLWKRCRIIKKMNGQLFLGGKKIFIEGSKASDNRRIVDDYKKTIRKGRGSVLFCVFRGRNAEGSNFPYEMSMGVILVGVPYADYSDPLVKAQIKYFNNKKKSMGERWYTLDAFRAANQALGRGIRHRDDWCNFILMDHRYLNHKKFLSEWTISNGIQTIPDYDSIVFNHKGSVE
jgi:regulator of telomere elongation helicase 1